MEINLISSKDSNETGTSYANSNSLEIMIGYNIKWMKSLKRFLVSFFKDIKKD